MKNEPTMTVERFERLLKTFLNKYDADLLEYKSKLSSFFEMKMYNEVIRAYEQMGYISKICNLFGEDNVFRYKNTPNGYIENFSYFEVEKNGEKFWIIHNLKCETFIYRDCYITPDIVVCKENSIERKIINKSKVDCISNDNLVTFFVCKFMAPFPELIAGFIGLLYCLVPDFELNEYVKGKNNIAPGLLCSGKGSSNSIDFKNKVNARLSVNIFENLSYKTLKAAIKKRELNLFGNRVLKADEVFPIEEEVFSIAIETDNNIYNDLNN